MNQRLPLFRLIVLVAIFFCSTNLFAQHTINGVIAANEYGANAEGVNKQNNMYMHWDATNLYIAVINVPVSEAFVFYIDKNPLQPINAGANANGTLVGYNSYDATSFSNLNIRADFVAYVKNTYREYRRSNGTNGWTTQTTAFGTYADNASNIREISIPWTAMGFTAGTKPTTFAFIAYTTTAAGVVSNQLPAQNPSGTIGTTAVVKGYYYVGSTVTTNAFVDNAPAGNMEWANLQFPQTATVIKTSTSANIFMQIFHNGYTNKIGKANGMEVWIGINSANTNPSTWLAAAWTPAVYYKDAGNNDEYMAPVLASSLAAGTYYYAVRVRTARTDYRYGGYNTGFWNATTNPSGVLTVQNYTGQVITFPQPAVTTTPAFPTATSNITVNYNAALGNLALNNYVGDVYTHTGVTTAAGNWQNSSAWLDNAVKYKLTPVSTNNYSLNIGVPATYYGTGATTIQKLNMIFRNADGSKQGKTVENGDFMIPIYAAGLQVRFNYPTTQPTIVRPTDLISIQAECNSVEAMKLYLDNVLISGTTTTGGKLSYNVNAGSTTGLHTIRVDATQGASTASASTTFFVTGTPVSTALSANMKDGINYISSTSVTLVLFAPNKQFVHLIGDFNSWAPNNSYLMKRTPDNLRYWITLTGLTAGTEYGFQYLIDGKIRVADMYADKVLDQSNDPWISTTTYPSLKAYPTATSEIVSVFQTNQTAYTWAVPNFVGPSSSNLVIYELHIRDFTSTGDINGMMGKLDYLKTLGVNAIELMPINEFEGNDSWGYNPSFYFAPDKAYGTKTAYKQLIDACHSRGMAVIGDMVLNHSFNQSPMVRMYFDGTNPTSDNPWFNVTAPHVEYNWGSDFNHERAATRDFVDRVTSYWLTEYKLDGMRFDFTKGFTNTYSPAGDDGGAYDASRIANLKRMYDAIKTVKPSAYVIAEHLAWATEDKELADYGILMWSGKALNTAYNQCAMGYNANSNLWGAYYQTRTFTYPNWISYAESHDEERNAYTAKAFGAVNGSYNVKSKSTYVYRTAAVEAFNLFFPGPRMLWQFEELAYDVSIDSLGRTGKKPVRWEYFEDADRRALYTKMAKLIQYRKQNPTIFDWKIDYSEDGDCKRIRYINPATGVVDAVLIANFGTAYGSILPGFGVDGKKWFDVITNNAIGPEYNTATNKFGLNAGEFRLYIRDEIARTYTVRAPIGDNVTVTTTMNTAKTFAASDIKFFSVDYSFAGIKIASLPALGTLKYNGVACAVGTVVSNLALLVYTPVTGATGTPYTSFTYKVRDNSGLAATEYSENAVKVTINVTSGARIENETNITTEKNNKENSFNTLSPKEHKFGLYPNPTSVDNINIQVSSFEQCNVTISITDIYGKTVFVQKINLNEGVNTLKINTAYNLPSGIYVVKIREFDVQGKILITK